MTLKTKRTLNKVLTNVIFILGSIIMLIPFALALVNSFKSKVEAQHLQLSLPGADGWHFENYITVFNESNFLRSFMNGLLYSVLDCVIIVLLGSLTAFVLSRRGTKLAKFINNILIIGIFVPGSLIATYLTLKFTGLLGTYLGLILVYICGSIPQAIFLYTGFISSIPRELDEAAFIDGASLPRTFYQVIFPTLKPITATVVVLTFMNVWNDFQSQLFYGTTSMRGLPISVYQFFGRYSQNWNLVFADIVMTMIPVLIVYFAAQKYIISGMTSGAVKG